MSQNARHKAKSDLEWIHFERTRTEHKTPDPANCCGNCAYFNHFKNGSCTFKEGKPVKVYNICERHTEAK